MNQAIKNVAYKEDAYPKLLRTIQNPPKVLYYIGDISLASKLSVSIVGTRKATEYGRWAASELAKTLAEHGVVVTSGLAAGIDSFGHKGALQSGGKTIAVLGCGVDICSPASNRRLMSDIAETGLILSEYEPGTHATVYTFPQRNRIISGISAATVVVEAGLSSGSLITAESAVCQGREVYAVPGSIDSIYSIGTNKLIKEGALPLIVLDDILDDLGVERKALAHRKKNLGSEEQNMLKWIETGGEVTIDYLCRMTKKPPSEVNGIITVLEIKGMIYSFMGKIFIAK